MNYLLNHLTDFFRIIYHKDYYVFYKMIVSDKATDTTDNEIVIYKSLDELPKFVSDVVFRFPILDVMHFRMLMKRAILICMFRGTNVCAYGWIQSWKSFRRKFGWLFHDAIMLGPYWTNPEHRGQGLYVRLLKKSISIAGEKKALVIFTAPDNINSQKGIQKAGFSKIGTYKVTFILRMFSFHSKVVE